MYLVLEVSEPVIRRYGAIVVRRLCAILVALVLLRLGVNLGFGTSFGAILVTPVIVLHLALLTTMYFAVEGLVKEEDKRTTIFAVCAIVLIVSVYIHLACLAQFMEHLLSRCSPPP
jgi:hypothetical protein